MKIKKIIIFILVFLLLNLKSVNSYENKIIYKLNNEIITSLDLKNEMKYLLALNPKLNELSKKKF